MKDGFSIDCSVETIATLNPRTFDDENLLASDALQIIENYKIQLLIITNKNRELKGLLHIHDLIEAGIK
jgi:arabinose-5-phosphate isomerase